MMFQNREQLILRYNVNLFNFIIKLSAVIGIGRTQIKQTEIKSEWKIMAAGNTVKIL